MSTKNFINRVRDILSYQKRTLDNLEAILAPKFSPFSYVGYDERTMSSIIRGLLDPKGDHGQGDLFLRKFFEKLSLEYEDTKNGTVKCEAKTHNGRFIDILVCTDNYCIGIENKLWAGDQENQVADYLKYIKTSFKDKKSVLIYLSIDGREPSDFSIDTGSLKDEEENGNIVIQDYHFILSWLEDSLAYVQAENVRWYIKEIINIIKKDFYGESLFMSNNKEIKEIIMNTEDVVVLISQLNSTKTEVKKEVCASFVNKLKDKLEEMLPKAELTVKWDIRVNEEDLETKWVNIIVLTNNTKKISQYTVGIDFDFNDYRGCYFYLYDTDNEDKKYVRLEGYSDIKTLDINGYYFCESFKDWSSDENLQKLINYAKGRDNSLDRIRDEICENIINLASRFEELAKEKGLIK